MKLEELEERQSRLKDQLKFAQSPEFIEKEAREKLSMGRENETVLVLPENLEDLIGVSQTEQVKPLPNWKRWWKLFFGG